MGRSHALAYHQLPEFEIVGICTRSQQSRDRLNEELGGSYPTYSDYSTALEDSNPDAVCISTYPDTHADYAIAALEKGCDVFVEKPLAENFEAATEVIECARKNGRKLVVGYILRHHPSWQKFVELAQTLGSPLVMRMNLNQKSFGDNWETHKNLMSSISPIVDCGVHYVDVMCQMSQSLPVRVSGIGARLTEDLPPGKINYGHLQVTFEDGSVGWYEAGWGPMMSETAFFIKDVVGPKGSVSIVATGAGAAGQSANVDAHTQTQALRLHYSGQLDENNEFVNKEELIRLDDEPDHDELCLREQKYFLDSISKDLDLSDHWRDAISSMKIVAAADESFKTGNTVAL